MLQQYCCTAFFVEYEKDNIKSIEPFAEKKKIRTILYIYNISKTKVCFLIYSDMINKLLISKNM